jgi:hypothetical protein
MKQNEIEDLPKLDTTRYENIFNVYREDNGVYFYNLLNSVVIDPDLLPTSFTLHYPVPGESYTGISYKYYNTIELWWLICAANNIDNPTKAPRDYSPLRILNRDIVVSLLTQINNR